MTEINKHAVYTPESPLRSPFMLIKETLRDIKASQTLAWHLTMRDIKAQYRQTAIGYLWAIFPPLSTSAVWIFLQYSNILAVKSEDIPYPLFALSGTIFWQLFLESFWAPLRQIESNRAMLSKVNFPREALLFTGVAQVIINFAIRLVFLVIVLVLFGVSLKLELTFLVLPVLGFTLVGTFLGILLIPVGALYKDIQQAVAIIIGPFMYLAPVVYPYPSSGVLKKAMELNPLTNMFTFMRNAIFKGITPMVGEILLLIIVSFILLMVSWLLIKVSMPFLIERMDA